MASEIGPAQRVGSMRVLALTLVTSPLLLAVVIFFVLPPSEGDAPGVPVTLGVLTLVAVGFVLANTIGYRSPPLPTGLTEHEAQVTSLVRYQSLLFLRFVMTEAPIIAALVFSFVVDYGPWPLVIAVIVGVPSMYFHVVPTRRAVLRVQSALEAEGSPSYVAEAFGW